MKSVEVPQADRIESVVMAIINIGRGAKTDAEIIKRIPGLNDPRQGRYYRKVAELLGFVYNKGNTATITPSGDIFLKNPSIKNPLFIERILRIEIFQILLSFIQVNSKKGLTRDQIVNYLNSFKHGLAPATLDRRTSSLLSWLKTLNIVEQVDKKYFIKNMIAPNKHFFEVEDVSTPILPKTADLNEYRKLIERVSSTQKIINFYKDQAKLERSNNAHKRLVNLVADRIKNAGGIPKSNQLIDLATTLEHDYIFEMKSTNKGNAKSQIRKGISQLYEYRYLQNKSSANLVLVVESPLVNDDSWLVDYMESDRNIHLVWDGDDQLYSTNETRNKLAFLNLK